MDKYPAKIHTRAWANRFTETGLRLIVLLLVAWSWAGVAQPVNDNFADRIILSGTEVVATGSVANATVEPDEPWQGTAYHPEFRRSIWWSWTTPADGVAEIAISGNGYGVFFAVFTGAELGALIEVKPLLFGQWSYWPPRFRVKAGTTYQIVADRVEGSSEEVTLRLSFSFRPINDDFANRIDLGSDNASAIGTNAAATSEPNERLTGYSPNGVWWTWRATTSGPVTLTVESGPLSPEDFSYSRPSSRSSVEAFVGNELDHLTRVAHGNDFGYGYPAVASASFEAVAGTTYQIRADGEFGLHGSFRLNVARTQPPTLIITVPARNAVFHAGEPVPLAVQAFDADGTVAKVDFYLYNEFTNFTSSLTDKPFRTQLPGLPPGRYSLMAYATDNFGAKGRAIPLEFDVRPANDDFARRIAFTGSSVTVTGAVADATLENGESGNPYVGSVWWQWTAPTSAPFTLTVISNPDYWTSLAVYTGLLLSDLTLVTNKASTGSDPSYSARAVIDAVAGTSYQLAISSQGSACTLNIAQTLPPSVTITSPTNDARFLIGEPVTFSADASDDGHISKVEFYLDYSTVPYTFTNPPFTLSLKFIEGNFGHTIRAAAMDDHGLGTYSDPVYFTINYPPPLNDNFADRIPLAGSFLTVTGSLAYATIEPGEPLPNRPSAWWLWTAPASAAFTITAISDFGAPSLAAYTGTSLPDLVLVTNDTFQGNDPSYSARVVIDAVAGTTYQLAVSSYGGDCTLNIAQTLAPSVSVTSPTNGARFLLGEPVTFSADVSDDGHVSKVEYYLGGYRLLGMSTNPPFTVSVPFTNLNLGQDFRARATDNYGLSTYSDPVYFTVNYPPPSNDNFADRIQLAGSFLTVTSSLAHATSEPGELFQYDVSVWWSWTAPASGPFTITAVLESGYWPTLAVYTGTSLPDLILITNDTFHGNNPSYSARVVIDAAAGTTYQLAISSWGGACTLNVAQTLPPSVTITSPTNGTVFLLGHPARFSANAADDGHVSKVDFYLDDYTLLGSSTNSPFVLSVTFTKDAYNHRVRAVATDNLGLTALSDVVEFNVDYPPSDNDDFQNRQRLAGEWVSVNISSVNATREAGEPDCPGPGPCGTVWWSWVAPASGRVTLLAVRNQSFLSVYTGATLDDLTLVAGEGPGADDSIGQLSFQAVRGEEYHIRLATPPGAWVYSELNLLLDAVEFTQASKSPAGPFQSYVRATTERLWIVDSSSDLLSWAPVKTNVSVNGGFKFVDPTPPSEHRRFYRLRPVP